MGGQLEFFGLWIDAEYGKARCAPSCSSYQSPQLSEKEYFHYDHLEVWAVGEEPELEDEDGVRYEPITGGAENKYPLTTKALLK